MQVGSFFYSVHYSLTRTQLHSYPIISPADAHKQTHILTIGSLPHIVDILLEIKQDECISPLSWSVHHNFVNDGKQSERGWACTPHPHQPWQYEGIYARKCPFPLCVYSVVFLGGLHVFLPCTFLFSVDKYRNARILKVGCLYCKVSVYCLRRNS